MFLFRTEKRRQRTILVPAPDRKLRACSTTRRERCSRFVCSFCFSCVFIFLYQSDPAELTQFLEQFEGDHVDGDVVVEDGAIDAPIPESDADEAVFAGAASAASVGHVGSGFIPPLKRLHTTMSMLVGGKEKEPEEGEEVAAIKPGNSQSVPQIQISLNGDGNNNNNNDHNSSSSRSSSADDEAPPIVADVVRIEIDSPKKQRSSTSSSRSAVSKTAVSVRERDASESKQSSEDESSSTSSSSSVSPLISARAVSAPLHRSDALPERVEVALDKGWDKESSSSSSSSPTSSSSSSPSFPPRTSGASDTPNRKTDVQLIDL